MACFWRGRRDTSPAPNPYYAHKENTSARIQRLEKQFDAEVWMALKYPPDRVGNDYHMHRARSIAYEILQLYKLLITGLVIHHDCDPIPQYQAIRQHIVQRLDSTLPLSPRLSVAQV